MPGLLGPLPLRLLVRLLRGLCVLLLRLPLSALSLLLWFRLLLPGLLGPLLLLLRLLRGLCVLLLLRLARLLLSLLLIGLAAIFLLLVVLRVRREIVPRSRSTAVLVTRIICMVGLSVQAAHEPNARGRICLDCIQPAPLRPPRRWAWPRRRFWEAQGTVGGCDGWGGEFC